MLGAQVAAVSRFAARPMKIVGRDQRPPASPTKYIFELGQVAKARSMPTNDRLRLNDGKDPQDRRKPAVKLDQKQPIKVREMAVARLTP
jgi:hypothetical protein